MELLNCVRALTQIKSGVFTRVSYISVMRTKAAFNHTGYRLIKVTNTTSRFGIKYNNIQAVVDKAAKNELAGKEKKHRANNKIELLTNKLVFNTNTQQAYVKVFATKNHNTKNEYYLVNVNSEIPTYEKLFNWQFESEYEKYLIESQRNLTEVPVLKEVNIDNIYRIGNYGSDITETQVKDYVLDNFKIK